MNLDMNTVSKENFVDENRFSGSIRYSFSLSKISWLKVGGPVDILFRPRNLDDLSSFLSAIPLETVRRRVMHLEKKRWVKYTPNTGVIYSPSEENNNLIVEINNSEKEFQANYLNVYEKSRSPLSQ